MKNLTSVAWILQYQDGILCVKTKGKSKYFLPGGKPEPNESHQEALKREIKEELRIDLDPDSIRFAFDVNDIAYGLEDTTLTMYCYTADFTGDIKPDSEIESAAFLTLSQLELCAPAAQQVLNTLLK